MWLATLSSLLQQYLCDKGRPNDRRLGFRTQDPFNACALGWTTVLSGALYSSALAIDALQASSLAAALKAFLLACLTAYLGEICLWASRNWVRVDFRGQIVR
jgi:hypothetical protein